MRSDPRITRLKILVVDDEPVNVILLEHILREGGYKRLQSLTDSRVALETTLQFEPDIGSSASETFWRRAACIPFSIISAPLGFQLRTKALISEQQRKHPKVRDRFETCFAH